MKKILYLFFFFLVLIKMVAAQDGLIKGRVYDATNNEALAFGVVQVPDSEFGSQTDAEGYYELRLAPGVYNLRASYLGYEDLTVFEIIVSRNKPALIDFAMKSNESDLGAVVIIANPFVKKEESPLSLRSIGTAEIQRNPGGGRDISKAIRTLPGVTRASSFRNDLLIRGGGPGENRFYLDDVEVPNINHFATQGASGGPVGMINVDFIREVNFFSSAFPANRGNALSSVMNFQQKNGRDDRLGFSATLGSSDLALTAEGPLTKNKKTTFIASARQSYLQFLFAALGLPFLPTYNDFQVKVRSRINPKNEIYFTGLGAIDKFKLNLEANDTEEQQALLDLLPVSPQWNYTNGLVYKHFAENGYWTFVLSRNMLNNRSYKYAQNVEIPENLLLDYTSQEIENKLRIEHTMSWRSWQWNYGLSYERAKYNTSIFQKIVTPAGQEIIDADTDIKMHKYGMFMQASRKFFKERFITSAGIRMDGSSYNTAMQNPLKQLSPRISASFAINEHLSINANTGIYYQLPAYTIMGYRDNNGVPVNKESGLRYIRNDHLVAGLEWASSKNSRITLEGFYKRYHYYPFSLRYDINLANLGSDFGVIGNEPVRSTGRGRAYGMELMAQQKLYKGFYGIAAYTLSWSAFTDKNNIYVPSSWETRHILNLVAGKRYKRNWETGINFRFQTGLPITPYDYDRSALVANWNINPAPLYNYALLNTGRGQINHQLDIRVDKRWYFKNWNLNLYLDIANLYSGPSGQEYPTVLLAKDENGQPIILNPADPPQLQQYQLNIKPAVNTATAIPTIGIIIEH